MNYLKYKHQSIFPMWGRVKLNFRDRYERPNIYSKNSSRCQVFFTGLSKNVFGIILQTLTHPSIHVINCKLCKLVMGIPPVMPLLHQMPPHLSCLPNVEEPMKYQALRPQFFSVGRWRVVEWVVVGWVGVGVVGWVVVVVEWGG